MERAVAEAAAGGGHGGEVQVEAALHGLGRSLEGHRSAGAADDDAAERLHRGRDRRQHLDQVLHPPVGDVRGDVHQGRVAAEVERRAPLVRGAALHAGGIGEGEDTVANGQRRGEVPQGEAAEARILQGQLPVEEEEARRDPDGDLGRAHAAERDVRQLAHVLEHQRLGGGLDGDGAPAPVGDDHVGQRARAGDLDLPVEELDPVGVDSEIERHLAGGNGEEGRTGQLLPHRMGPGHEARHLEVRLPLQLRPGRELAREVHRAGGEEIDPGPSHPHPVEDLEQAHLVQLGLHLERQPGHEPKLAAGPERALARRGSRARRW